MSLPLRDDKSPIGVFDSGVGGLTVLAEIHRLLPKEQLIYIADSAHAPYGDRSVEYIRERAIKVALFLIDQGVKAIVIACNTATAETINLLRETVNIPVIGLEPAIKPAVEQSNNGIVGVLATKRTIDSKRLLGLAERYAQGKKVLVQACPGLVEKVEAGGLNNKQTRALLKRYIQPLLDQGADTLILGCTHYPFLLPAINTLVKDNILLLETSKPVALQLQRILKNEKLESSQTDTEIKKETTRIAFYNSGATTKLSKTMRRLWKLAIQNPSEKSSIKTIDVLPLPTLN